MNYYIYGYTDKGNYLRRNEDCILVNRETVKKGSFESVCIAPFISAVCDGVGGERSGSVASELCVRSLSILDYDSSVDLEKQIVSIHNKIIRQGVSSVESLNMQTTLCCLAVDENGFASCYNVGDSRLYRYVNNNARQISTDQTYGRFLYDQGEVDHFSDVDQAMQKAIVSSLGSIVQRPTIEHVDFVTPFGVISDDVVVICSDGVSDFISEVEIETAMKVKTMTFSEKIDALCALALRNGSKDNVSIIGIKPWKTDKEYERLIGGFISSDQKVDTIRAGTACLKYEQRYQNNKLVEQADNSLQHLFDDLEEFKKT